MAWVPPAGWGPDRFCSGNGTFSLQDLLLNDQVKEFAAIVYETFSTPQELQK